MARCAVVDAAGIVVNIIEAQVTDLAPDGCVLFEIPVNTYTNPGELWADRLVVIPDDPVLGE